jgi:hypothetical protein
LAGMREYAYVIKVTIGRSDFYVSTAVRDYTRDGLPVATTGYTAELAFAARWPSREFVDPCLASMRLYRLELKPRVVRVRSVKKSGG